METRQHRTAPLYPQSIRDLEREVEVHVLKAHQAFFPDEPDQQIGRRVPHPERLGVGAAVRAAAAPLRRVLSQSFAFGGSNAALVLEAAS